MDDGTGEIGDGALVARCRKGDPAAWSMLVRRYSPYVHAIATHAYRLPAADAEDVFQEVFARTYGQLSTLRDDGAIRPWLAQLTRRLCVDRLRASARTVPVAAHDDVANEGGDLDLALAVRAALADLPDPAREVLERFFIRDESYRTIADALGIPPGTVASRISRALAALRTNLETDLAPLTEETGAPVRLVHTHDSSGGVPREGAA